MNLKIKICGITNPGDAQAAVEAGANALGFMFYEPSPRNVSLGAAANIIRGLPPFVAKVGVFVNAAEPFIRQAIGECGIDTLRTRGCLTVVCQGSSAARARSLIGTWPSRRSNSAVPSFWRAG